MRDKRLEYLGFVYYNTPGSYGIGRVEFEVLAVRIYHYGNPEKACVTADRVLTVTAQYNEGERRCYAPRVEITLGEGRTKTALALASALDKATDWYDAIPGILRTLKRRKIMRVFYYSVAGWSGYVPWAFRKAPDLYIQALRAGFTLTRPTAA